ncbi:hypothetical protein VNO80_28482 [Phaseolus coccineus]|uniref:Uncharacterized protein n=1 Tax=Phaseolus coccineus TaxID=3886 RepID=A0AAN9QE19_PHACN
MLNYFLNDLKLLMLYFVPFTSPLWCRLNRYPRCNPSPRSFFFFGGCFSYTSYFPLLLQFLSLAQLIEQLEI